MKGRVLNNFYGNSNRPEDTLLFEGDIVKIRILEYDKDLPDIPWCLVDTRCENTHVHVTDIKNVNRLYEDPALGDYRNGKYIWLDPEYLEIIHEKNIHASYLLKRDEFYL